MTRTAPLRKLVRIISIYLVCSYTLLLWANLHTWWLHGTVTTTAAGGGWVCGMYAIIHPFHPVAQFEPVDLSGWWWLELCIGAVTVGIYFLIVHNIIDWYKMSGRNDLDKPALKRFAPKTAALGIWTPDGKPPLGVYPWLASTLNTLRPGAPLYRSNGMLVLAHGPQPGDRMLIGCHKVTHLLRRHTYNVYARPEHHTIVYGPSGTGKGASQMNPSLLFWNGSTADSPDGHGIGWPGPIISATVKNDHVDVSLEWRHCLSTDCYIYDPMGAYPAFRDHWVGWNPLSEIRNFNDASKVAQALMDSEQQESSTKSGTDDYFHSQALLVLGPMLLSASIGRQPFKKVYEWCMTLEAEATNPDMVSENGTVNPASNMYTVMNYLYDYAESTGEDICVEQMKQIFTKDPREASSVWGSIRKALQPYNDEKSVASTSDISMPRMFDPDHFFTTPAATLYIIAPEVASEAKRMRPVFAAFISWLIEQAQRIAREHNGKLPYPVLANLDEVKNVGAIPNFGHTLSLVRSAGFFVKHAWQDDAQIESAYGKDDSKTIVSNSRTWVVLPGISDVNHLDALAKIIGERTITKVSHSRKAGSVTNESQSVSRERQAAANVAAVKELPDGTVLIFSDNMTPFIIRQHRYYEDPVMLARYKLGDTRRATSK